MKKLRSEFNDLGKFINENKIQVINNKHEFQKVAAKNFEELGFKASRVMNGVFLLSSPKKFVQVGEVFDKMKDRNDLRIICLDQVTDPQNAAAVVRTAAFYGVDYLILPGKSSSAHSPGFYRISSGGAEHLTVIYVSNLSRFITRCNELGALCIGFSEHGDETLSKDVTENKNIVLVMGNEEKGISNAVMRSINHFCAFKPQGSIKSLNVSVAQVRLRWKSFLVK